MKKLFLWVLVAILAVFIGAQLAQAAPFLVCDPVTSNKPTHYAVKLNSGAFADVPADIQGTTAKLKYDLSAVPVGTNHIDVKAVIIDVWGRSESVAVPFDFTRPSAPLSPLNLSIIP